MLGNQIDTLSAIALWSSFKDENGSEQRKKLLDTAYENSFYGLVAVPSSRFWPKLNAEIPDAQTRKELSAFLYQRIKIYETILTIAVNDCLQANPKSKAYNLLWNKLEELIEFKTSMGKQLLLKLINVCNSNGQTWLHQICEGITSEQKGTTDSFVQSRPYKFIEYMFTRYSSEIDPFIENEDKKLPIELAAENENASVILNLLFKNHAHFGAILPLAHIISFPVYISGCNLLSGKEKILIKIYYKDYFPDLQNDNEESNGLNKLRGDAEYSKFVSTLALRISQAHLRFDNSSARQKILQNYQDIIALVGLLNVSGDYFNRIQTKQTSQQKYELEQFIFISKAIEWNQEILKIL
ncbi:MAG: hypothetical protein ACK4PR_02375, partial [Gammaproteobacteria bacterium]